MTPADTPTDERHDLLTLIRLGAEILGGVADDALTALGQNPATAGDVAAWEEIHRGLHALVNRAKAAFDEQSGAVQ